MSWLITPSWYDAADPDTLRYIQVVNAADAAAGQTGGLKQGVRLALDKFIVGCKADGIWNAIKASCIMVGARTLAGALVPLKGTAPTNFNFVSGDYNRKTGLMGDGSTKYLNSNRNNNADPQNSQHLSVYINTADTSATNAGYIGCGLGNNGASHIFRSPAGSGIASRSRNNSAGPNLGSANDIGFIGISRSASGSYIQRNNLVDNTVSIPSQTPLNESIVVFGRNGVAQADARIPFYSIGESLDLALLDARVTDLIDQLAAAIP